MAEAADDKLAEGKLDLVPMIDCIMLLLLFFILTTKFTSEEKSIASLLPTDKGQSAATPTKVEPPQQINIRIYPPDMQPAMQPSEYEAALRQIQTPSQPVINTAWLRIGPNEPIVVDGKFLRQKGGDEVRDEVEKIHQYIYQALEKFETGNTADRKSQCAITIHCFSQMSWKYALVAYDACRAYEAKHSGKQATGDPKDFDDAREVDFAPPRIRDYSQHELGNELYEIVNMK
jgi:biopolymer transport protein ExbD